MKNLIARTLGFFTSLVAWLMLAQSAFAQTASTASSALSSGKGGTSSSLPAAGSTELTYILFIGGVVLFVVGTLKLVLSFKE